MYLYTHTQIKIYVFIMRMCTQIMYILFWLCFNSPDATDNEKSTVALKAEEAGGI